MTLVTEDELARAILRAAREDKRRDTTSGLEWYGSAGDMARAILDALHDRSVLPIYRPAEHGHRR
jgi:hypothetical protein